MPRTHKLTLQRETLRQLTPTEAAQIVGGTLTITNFLCFTLITCMCPSLPPGCHSAGCPPRDEV